MLPESHFIAYDGEQALKFLDELEFQPDFVLLDLNLPKRKRLSFQLK